MRQEELAEALRPLGRAFPWIDIAMFDLMHRLCTQGFDTLSESSLNRMEEEIIRLASSFSSELSDVRAPASGGAGEEAEEECKSCFEVATQDPADWGNAPVVRWTQYPSVLRDGYEGGYAGGHKIKHRFNWVVRGGLKDAADQMTFTVSCTAGVVPSFAGTNANDGDYSVEQVGSVLTVTFTPTDWTRWEVVVTFECPPDPCGFDATVVVDFDGGVLDARSVGLTYGICVECDIDNCDICEFIPQATTNRLAIPWAILSSSYNQNNGAFQILAVCNQDDSTSEGLIEAAPGYAASITRHTPPPGQYPWGTGVVIEGVCLPPLPGDCEDWWFQAPASVKKQPLIYRFEANECP